MPSMAQQDLHSALETLPLELLQHILSLLNISTLKRLSLASRSLRATCFPHIFRAVFLYGPTCTFVDDFNERAPTRMHTLGLTWIIEDISAKIPPWCVEVHTLKISSGNIRNTVIIPSLSILRDLELSRLTFWVMHDYFRLLANLPPTLKKLSVHGIQFRFEDSGTGCYATVHRGAVIEHLETHLGEDLTILLRDDCPISFKSLRVAYVPQCRRHDLEALVQRTPHLVDLRLDIATPDDRPGSCSIILKQSTEAQTLRVSLPPTGLRSLSITDGTEISDTLIELFSTLSTLEVLNITFPLRWLVGTLDTFAAALSQPGFRNLKGLNLQVMKSVHCVNRSVFFEERLGRLRWRLGELGMSPKIKFTAKLVPDRSVSDIMRRLY
ncbi:hypothetical protein IW261DRAFT_1520456 [Armillaria novae-zelandiae]|uniref:F-box domain-containing protein n=1 Tax=Armillaria novae-zelandiae TaxID=153914 RepID=A0AA39NJA3_9AGAR|nr:hypothetical protein IW261DRAFT_1520456 [Armillaria novae-zelandiae]